MLRAFRAFVIRAGLGLRDFFTKEDGAVDVVAIVVLIGIVVLVAIVFRKQISSLIVHLFQNIEQNATDAISPSNSN